MPAKKDASVILLNTSSAAVSTRNNNSTTDNSNNSHNNIIPAREVVGVNITPATAPTNSTMLPMPTSTSTSTPTDTLLDFAAEQRNQLHIANTKLCRLVRKCPWMYDRNHPNYGKKQILDKSWTKISKDCNDSVHSCKERWRNIRAAFARSINIYKTTSGPNRVKPYYLHQELRFLVKPMLENREKLKLEYGDITKDEDVGDEETNGFTDDNLSDKIEQEMKNHNEDDDDDSFSNLEEFPNMEPQLELLSDTVDYSFADKPMTRLHVNEHDLSRLTENSSNCTPIATNITNISTPMNSTNVENVTSDVNDKNVVHAANGYKRTISSVLTPVESEPTEMKSFHTNHNHSLTNHNANMKFLEALLPDMNEMNARQRIIFKRKIYQALEEVFEITADFPSGSKETSTVNAIVKKVKGLNEHGLMQLDAFMRNNLQQISVNQQQQQQQQVHCNGGISVSGNDLTIFNSIPAQQRTQLAGNATTRQQQQQQQQLIHQHLQNSCKRLRTRQSTNNNATNGPITINGFENICVKNETEDFDID